MTIRLFSHVALRDGKLTHQPGSLLGATALVAGTTIGAGVLALPAVTLPAGVIPSTIALVGAWLYAVVSGLLLAEVNLRMMQQSGSPNAGLLAMIEHSLGRVGASVAGAAYLFLHYALLVAYIAQGGGILLSVLERFGLVSAPAPWMGTLIFTGLFGGILYWGRSRLVEQLNNGFVAIVLLSFVGLLGFAIGQVHLEQGLAQNWSAIPSALSVMLVALFFHNVIPVITTQLEGDVPKIRRAIVVGSGIPLGMFLAWNAVILCNLSPEMIASEMAFDPLEVLRSGGAGETLGALVTIFSEFAIVTSFIGFVYGLLDFFQDAFRVSLNNSSQRFSLYSLVLLPALGLSTLNPNIFLVALDYAGTFSISMLGGLLPAVMAWQQRSTIASSIPSLVPGREFTLVVMMTIAIGVFCQQWF